MSSWACHFILCLSLIGFTSSIAKAADDKKAVADKPAEKFGEHPLDGINIEAVETYRNPAKNQFDFALGVWPLNPYFNGFSIDAGYNLLFGKSWALEFQGSYIFTVDKGLVSELADTYGQQPSATIERPNYILASDVKYTIAYGKFIFFNEHIRYFRSQVFGGAALVITNKTEAIGGDIGWIFEAYVNDMFSWKLQMRDVIATIGSTTNNLELSIGTGYAF
jgi:outer membrane beta-barrel protein